MVPFSFSYTQNRRRIDLNGSGDTYPLPNYVISRTIGLTYTFGRKFSMFDALHHWDSLNTCKKLKRNQ